MTTHSTTDPAASVAPLQFDAPGLGSWELDSSHQSQARGRLMAELFEEPFTEGFRSTFERYGLPLEALIARTVNGWVYIKAKPVGAPEKSGGKPPPEFVLKVLTRLIPEFRRRNRTARAALVEKRWLRDVDGWEGEREQWVAAGVELLGQSVASMDDTALRDHTRSVLDRAKAMMLRHFELVGPAVGVGRLLDAGETWGIDRVDLLELLRGASPASSATLEPLRRLAELARDAGVEPASVASLSAISDEAAALIDRYLLEWGWRVLGDDIEQPTLMDEPDRLAALVRAVGDDLGSERPAADSDPTVLLRDRVPAEERTRFDTLVDEARRAYGSLDDHSGMAAWYCGIARRAVLEVARRAIDSGRLAYADDVWNLSVTELLAVAGGDDGPGFSELADRAAVRVAATDPPDVLGDPAGAPPSAAVFPSPMSEMVASFGAFLAAKFDGPAPAEETTGESRLSGRVLIGGGLVAEGHGVGSEPVTARVIVAHDAADAMDRVTPGDILVCSYTTASWNSVFPLLGGIVTAHGGPIGHTGVMAREFYLPAVIGIGEIDPAWDGQVATLEPRSS